MESNLKEEQRMSDVLKAMEERRSIRKYKADMVPQEIIDKIIEAGLYAAKKDWPTGIYDGSLVMGNLMLAAHDLGIGSCWIHRAKEEFETEWGKEFLKSLGIEEEYVGIGHCALGYVEGDEPKAAPRKENRVYYVK